MCICDDQLSQDVCEHYTVQILVEVAITHAETMRAEEGKGFKNTNLPTQTIRIDWLIISSLLKRYPFSGRVNSAGELLHTP